MSTRGYGFIKTSYANLINTYSKCDKQLFKVGKYDR